MGSCVLILAMLYTLQRGLLGEEAPPTLHLAGENVMLSWKLPSTNATVITIAKDSYTTTLFSGFTSSSEPEPVVNEKYKDRLEVLGLYTGTVSFNLKNVMPADAGHYLCIEGVGVVRIPDCGQTLVIIDQPVDVRVSARSAAVVGQNLVLECQAKSTSLPADHSLPLLVEWYNTDGHLLTSGQDKETVNGSRLIVRSVRRHDEGLQYMCRAADGLNMWSERSQPYHLLPEYHPTADDVQLIPADRVVSVINSGNLERECTATCRPRCTFSWQKLENTGDVYTQLSDGPTLQLSNIQRDRDGIYRCVATNEHGSASQSLNVEVKYKPGCPKTFINGQERPTARVTEGRRVNLTCVFDSNPAPRVAWYSQQDRSKPLLDEDLAIQAPIIVRSDRMTHTNYLADFIIADAACSHTNRYTCKARNSIGVGCDGDIELSVACVPRSVNGELGLKNMYMSPVDQRLDIKFQVEAFPEPVVKSIISEDESGRRRLEEENSRWTQSRSTSKAYPYLTTITIRFPALAINFFDRTYYLNIDNDEGTKILAFKLMARGPPKPPANVTVVTVDDHGMVLYFVPGFHGGKPQNFSVEYQVLSDSKEEGYEGDWMVLNTGPQGVETGQPLEVRVQGLEPGTTYRIRIRTANEHGSNISSVLTVSTLAADASSANSGTVTGIAIAVIVVLVIMCVVVIMVVRKRRKSDEEDDVHETKQPMLSSDENRGGPSPKLESALNATSKGSGNNTTHSEQVNGEKADPIPSDARQMNKEGLIYAELDLKTPDDSAQVKPREDTVNYETIDFTRSVPAPPLACEELPSDKEEIK